MKSILDPTFRYVPSAQTDIRKTFARIRREQRKAREETADQYIVEIVGLGSDGSTVRTLIPNVAELAAKRKAKG